MVICMKMNGPGWKNWTGKKYESGRSKNMQVDGPQVWNRMVQNIKLDGPRVWKWMVIKIAKAVFTWIHFNTQLNGKKNDSYDKTHI